MSQSKPPPDLTDLIARGAGHRGHVVARVIAFGEDGEYLGELHVPKPGTKRWETTAPGELILTVLAECPGRMTAQELADACGYERFSGWFREALDGLHKQGLILKSPDKFYSLPPRAAD